MSKSQITAWVSLKGAPFLGGIAFGLYLLSSPKCNRGCRTIAEHLITHGIDDLI
jgi:hypothetical protein